jgi:ACR3 family arsenite efflux pump ArsB
MKWYEVVRRVVVFTLGVLCFLKGIFYEDNSVPELIIGMIMVGILPIDDLFFWPPRRKRDRDADGS